MPAKQVIRDFVISIGFDSRQATRSIDALEKRITSLGKKSNALNAKIATGPSRVASVNQRGSKAVVNDEKQALAIAKRRHALNKSLQASNRQRKFGPLDSSAQKFDRAAVIALERDYNRLQKTISKATTPASLFRTQRALDNYKRRVTEATGAQRRFNREMRAANPLAKGFAASLRNMSRSYVSIFAVLAGGVAANRTMQDLESIQAVMLNASDSAEQAAENMRFVSKESSRLGLDIIVGAKGFAQFGTAAKAAGFEIEQTRKLFTGINEIITANGLSVDDASGVMRAFVQIMSKGNVQAEELRGQLGDRLAAAFPKAAEAMGMTTDELNRQLKAGKVNSKEFVERFIPHMQQFVRENGSLDKGLKTSRRAMIEFTNAIKETVGVAGASGLSEGMAELWKGLAAVMRALKPVAMAVGNIFGFITGVVGKLLQLLEPVFFLITSIFGVIGSVKSSLFRVLGVGGAKAQQALVASSAGGATGFVTGPGIKELGSIYKDSLDSSFDGFRRNMGMQSVDNRSNSVTTNQINITVPEGVSEDAIQSQLENLVPNILNASLRSDI